ncbi:MAG: cytochrome c [Spirochaetia bacterium]|nr:cytochrome c [Spirochaetia bacterium]
MIKKLSALVFISLLTSAVFAEDGDIFKKKCGVCHALNNVSKAKQGPDLTGYAAKRSNEYLQAYMTNPAEAKKKFPDIYNKEVKGKYQFAMPSVKLTDTEKQSILNVLK